MEINLETPIKEVAKQVAVVLNIQGSITVQKKAFDKDGNELYKEVAENISIGSPFGIQGNKDSDKLKEAKEIASKKIAEALLDVYLVQNEEVKG